MLYRLPCALPGDWKFISNPLVPRLEYQPSHSQHSRLQRVHPSTGFSCPNVLRSLIEELVSEPHQRPNTGVILRLCHKIPLSDPSLLDSGCERMQSRHHTEGRESIMEAFD